jgi:hypothetical protein
MDVEKIIIETEKGIEIPALLMKPKTVEKINTISSYIRSGKTHSDR